MESPKMNPLLIFEKQLNRLQQCLRSTGRYFPVTSQGFSFFKAHSEGNQQLIVDRLEVYLDIFEMTLVMEDASDEQFIWNAFKKFNVFSGENFFEKYSPGDVVEFYDNSGIQVFRNYSFFDICSYSLEEIFARPWTDLYQRDSKIMRGINDTAIGIFSNKITKPVDNSVPEHDLVELESERRHRIRIKIKSFIPLRSKFSSTPLAAVIEKCQVLSTQIEAGQSEEKYEEVSPIS